jgi:GR25 family glycosyltransferase involved in LPS biosynthesis
MKIYCINLPRSVERRRFQENQAKRLNLDLTFIDAIDYRDIPESQLLQAANYWTRPINGKDVGCFHSHKVCWGIIAKENEPAMIIEDDIIFSKDINNVLRTIATEPFPKNRVYDLEYAPSRHTLAVNPHWQTDDLIATKIYINKVGAGCYILTPQVAAELLKSRAAFVMVDSWLWTRPWLEQLQIEPCPAVQSIYMAAPGNEVIQKSGDSQENYKQASYLIKKYLRLKIIIDQVKGGVLRGLIWGKKRHLRILHGSFTNLEKCDV